MCGTLELASWTNSIELSNIDKDILFASDVIWGQV